MMTQNDDTKIQGKLFRLGTGLGKTQKLYEDQSSWRSIVLERTRGAGAPEVLRRETAEEGFRLRRNQPLNMAPSAPKDRYCQADFFCATFSKKSIFLGPGKRFLFRQVLVIFGTLFGSPKKCVSKIAYEADANLRHRFAPSARTDIPQTSHRRAQVI